MICKRFALVGSGFIGQVHAASLARHEGSALTMVADAAPERAQALAARYGARAVTVSEAIHRRRHRRGADRQIQPRRMPNCWKPPPGRARRSIAKNRSTSPWRAPVRWWSGCSPERAGHCRL